MIKTRLLIALILVVSPLSFAGEPHVGQGDSRSEACEAAEKKAENAAKNSGLGGTCYDACVFENCTEKGSGSNAYWSCKTWSANHRGSCENDPSKIRVYE